MAKKATHSPKKKRRYARGIAPLGAMTVLLVILLILLGGNLRKANDAPAISPSLEYSGFSEVASEPSAHSSDAATSSSTEGETSEKEESHTEESHTEESTDSREEDWRLILVNRWNPMPEDYEVELTQLANGHAVDSRIYPDLQQMFDDARAEGLMPTISSSYRTADRQQQLLDDKLIAYENEGNSHEDARELAEAWVAVPGTSEHQMGIAVDITSADREAQAPDVIWQWLEEHCCEYGFIVRYPEEKSDITGVINEPWHFRYVGKEAAREIREQGVCLEEYLGRTEH